MICRYQPHLSCYCYFKMHHSYQYFNLENYRQQNISDRKVSNILETKIRIVHFYRNIWNYCLRNPEMT